MTQQDDRFWQLAVAASTPTAAELQRAEAELAALEPVPALRDEHIAALLAAAAAATAAPVRPVTTRRVGRRLLAAATALLLSLTVAAVALKVWSGQQSDRTLDFVVALRAVADTNQTEAERMAAVGWLDEHCAYAITAMLGLRTDPEPTVATRARDLCAALRANPTGRARANVRITSGELLALVAQALDHDAPAPRRLAALQAVDDAVAAGLSAMAAARFTAPEYVRTQAEFLQRLRNELRH